MAVEERVIAIDFFPEVKYFENHDVERLVDIIGIGGAVSVVEPFVTLRCVSTFLRRFLHRFSESVTSSPGWLIHATAGRAGGVGILRTNRSGCSA